MDNHTSPSSIALPLSPIATPSLSRSNSSSNSKMTMINSSVSSTTLLPRSSSLSSSLSVDTDKAQLSSPQQQLASPTALLDAYGRPSIDSIAAGLVSERYTLQQQQQRRRRVDEYGYDDDDNNTDGDEDETAFSHRGQPAHCKPACYDSLPACHRLGMHAFLHLFFHLGDPSLCFQRHVLIKTVFFLHSIVSNHACSRPPSHGLPSCFAMPCIANIGPSTTSTSY